MTEHIYRVTFPEPPFAGDQRAEFYFFSLAAIYEVFTREQVGCRVTNLWRNNIEYDRPYLGRCSSVSKEPIVRKPQNRKQGVSKKNCE